MQNMENTKENKYNLAGICPHCEKLVTVEIVVKTDFIKDEKEDKADGKTGNEAKPNKAGQAAGPEGNEPGPDKGKAKAPGSHTTAKPKAGSEDAKGAGTGEAD